MQDSDGIGRYYPQALVKQLNVTTHPQYGPYDITSMFNADAPFWYDVGNTEKIELVYCKTEEDCLTDYTRISSNHVYRMAPP